MSYNSSRGFYGDSYDRHVPLYNDQSTIYKMKETYWTTKQAVMRKLGKKEDEHIVASDSELDAKLEVFKAIQKSSMDLLRVIEKYQDRICVLSREENAMGRLLKSESQHDKTRAGKMMAAVGKAQCFSSQQMLQLRAPLVRLYQEVETFRYRAITDTLITVKRMEAARTEYRGTLLWMKDVSNELDPDTSKQLQKFRTVQAQVKKTKAKFDKLKLDVMQKIDLLAASRCNMFSHVLAKYQSTLLHFWEKTAFRMTAVADSFKGYQYYEFSMLKELGEPSKKLAEETGGADSTEKDVDDSQDEFSDDDEYDDARFAKRMRQEDDKEIDRDEITSQHLPHDLNAFNEEQELNQLAGETCDNSSQSVDLNASEDFVGQSSTTDENLFSLEPIPLSTAVFSMNSTLSNLAELLDTSGLTDTALPSNISTDRESHFFDRDIYSELSSQSTQSNAPCQNFSVLASQQQVGDRTRLKDVGGQLPPVPPIPKAAGALTFSLDGLDNNDLFKLDSPSLGSLDSIQPIANKNDSLNNLFLDGNKQKTGDLDAFIDFGDDEEVDLEEIKRKQDEEFDFTGMLKQSAAANKKEKQGADSKNVLDLLSDDMETVDLSDKDDMTILNEILNAPPASDDFSQEWNAVFGSSTPLSPATSNAQTLAPDRNSSSFPLSSDVMSSQFMPSSLLEMTSTSYGGGFNVSAPGQPMKSSLFNMASTGLQPYQQQQMGTNLFGGVQPMAPINTASTTAQKQPMAKKKNNKQELSAWFNLFAELDPLANPDAIGRKNDDITDA